VAIARSRRRITRRFGSVPGALGLVMALAAVFVGVACTTPASDRRAPSTEPTERPAGGAEADTPHVRRAEEHVTTPEARPEDSVDRVEEDAEGAGDTIALWSVGNPDDSQAEFDEYAAANPETIHVAPDERRARPGMSKGMSAARNPALEISFDLDEVPRHGAEFRFKLLHSHKSGPQMAVFSNGIMAGLIQLWGTAETTSPWPWRKTYRLYIPAELLTAGGNVLRLETVRPLWSDASVDRFVWWEWDYLAMDALSGPATVPIHGTVAYLGTTMKHSANDFKVDDDTLRLAPVAMRWMGIDYSGNTIRADFWWDVGSQQSRRREYLELLRDYNMTVIADHVSSNHFKTDPDGDVPARMKADIKRFLEQYGDLFQWYEIANEPCMFGGDLRGTVVTAAYVTAVKPAHVKTTAPGWAYGGGKGTPLNWARDAAFRREVERQCQATNGHSYGYSYADNEGGSFVENLETFEGVEDGWPVEYVNTETGTNNWHSEENGTRFASTQPHAQAFDRIMRAHVAVVDRTMQHAAIFDDFGLFNPPSDWRRPETLVAHSGLDGEDCRLKTFRRLALAYATHGAPLAYHYTNRADVSGRKVLFRPVDTRAIGALPGSGGTSDKVLLNFVNFELEPVTMEVMVTMPCAGVWTGGRIGAGLTTAEAFSRDIRIEAGPTFELTETLGAGEATQYILAPPTLARPYPSRNVSAEPDADRVTLRWSASTGATAYAIRRARSAGGPYATIVDSVEGTSYVDIGPTKGVAQRYVVVAKSGAGTSGPSDSADATPGAPRAPTGVRAVGGDGRIALEWDRGPGVSTWEVECAAARSGPFRSVARELREPRFVHENRQNGETTWYLVKANGATWQYVVSGLKEGVEGADSMCVSASPSRGGVPVGWKSADIGSPGHAGSTSYTPSSKAWTVIGSGHDIWGDRDGLHFAYLPLTGDGSLSVHLTSYEDTHVWAKIGVAVRESLEPGAAMAIMAVSPGKGCSMARSSTR
jgi:hypothetical protein